ncbi:MAG: S1C family serine protease [Mycobacterium leprae]
MHVRRRLATAVTVGLLLADCTTAGGDGGRAAAPAPTETRRDRALTGSSFDRIPEIVREVQPSVVTISTGDGLGSGVVYDSKGIIVTNEHVVRGARNVEVAFADGRRTPGRVRAADVLSDLALVQVDRGGLTKAQFQEKLPVVGELAVAIGSPLGLEETVTAGIISGVNRSVSGSTRQGTPLIDLIQTDAAISPGNSGGALVNENADVVGLNEAYLPPGTGAVSIGFAIPAGTVVDVARQLLEKGRAEHAYLGVQLGEVTPQVAESLGLSAARGALVLDVINGGPADRAGLRPGDVVVAVDGAAVDTVEELQGALRRHRPGDRLTLRVVRDRKERDVQVTLADRPSR